MAQASQADRSTSRSAPLGGFAFWLGRALVAFAIAIGIVFTIFPFLFMPSGNLKTSEEIFSLPPTLIPPTWQFQNWLDTYQALLVPFAASAFGIFMLRQYMVSIPDEFIDAAKVDGASGW